MAISQQGYFKDSWTTFAQSDPGPMLTNKIPIHIDTRLYLQTEQLKDGKGLTKSKKLKLLDELKAKVGIKTYKIFQEFGDSALIFLESDFNKI